MSNREVPGVVRAPLGESAEILYDFTLRQSSPPTLAEAGHDLNLTDSQVKLAVAELLRLKLLRAGAADVGRLVAVPPEAARIRMLAPVLQDLARRQREADRLWSTYTGLVAAYQEKVLRGARSSPIEPVLGVGAARGVIAELAAASRREVVASQPGGARDQEALAESLERADELLARGVKLRTLYQHPARHSQPTLTFVEHVTGQGAEVRTTSNDFARLMIFDRTVALIELRDDPLSAAVVRDPSVVDFMYAAFEFAWSSALPLSPGYDRSMVEIASDDTKAMIISLLVDGVDDRAIARRLGISMRTCQRHISEIMRRLGAKNRLHAGYLLHQLQDREIH